MRNGVCCIHHPENSGFLVDFPHQIVITDSGLSKSIEDELRVSPPRLQVHFEIVAGQCS